MYQQWIKSLVIGILLTGILVTPAWAGLNQGKFFPAGQTKTVIVDSQIRYYQIQKGDTLWDISRSFNVDVQTLASINNLERHSILRIGQTLRIPGAGQRLHGINRIKLTEIVAYMPAQFQFLVAKQQFFLTGTAAFQIDSWEYTSFSQLAI